MKFVQLTASLKGGISPVYYLAGEETYFREHAIRAIRDACALTQPLLNYSRCDGESLRGDKLYAFRDSLFQLPFFDRCRVVLVCEYYPSEHDWNAVLSEYVKNPCPSTVLIFSNRGTGEGKKKSIDLKRRDGIVFVDCAKESEETLTRWLYALMRREGLVIDADAAALMARYCAQDAARMRIETDKLKLALGEGGTVTRAVVEEYIAKDVDYKIYELTQAASAKNGVFFEILNDMTEKGFDEAAVLAALTAHFRTLCEVSGLRGTDAEVGKILGVKPYAVQRNRMTVSRLGAERVMQLYLALYSLSSGMKGGIYTQKGALFSAIAKIFFS